MADERRVWINSCGGLVEDANALGSGGVGMTAAATTLTAAGLGAASALASDEHFVIVFDPDGLTGAPFAKKCTDHASGSGTCTIETGAMTVEGLGTARDVPQGTPWVAGCVLKEDMAAPIITRPGIASPGNITTAAGATTTYNDSALTGGSGFRGRMVDAYAFTTVYGVTGSGSAAGLLEFYDVEGAVVIGVSRWHTNTVERQMQVGVYAKMWVPAGTTRTLRLRNTNDGGSSQSVECRDGRVNLTYEDR